MPAHELVENQGFHHMRMRHRLVPTLLLGAALLAGCAGGGDGASQDGAAAPPAKGVTEVAAERSQFVPAAIEVPAGTKVTWTLADGSVPHDVKGDGWHSGKPQTSGTYSHTFDTPGSYDYACTVHPQMTGRVVVTAAP
jgi:plastocyanin